MLINKDSLHDSAAHLIISNISENKVCIPKDLTIVSSQITNNDSYSINEITLTMRYNEIKADTQRNHIQKTHTVNTHTMDNTSGQLKSHKMYKVPKSLSSFKHNHITSRS